MNESLVLRIREISCVLKQLNMELRVSWKMEGGIGLQSLFLFSLLASFIISLFVPSFQKFDYCVPWCGFLHVSFAWFTEFSNLHGFCSSCLDWKIFSTFFFYFLCTPTPSQNPITCLLSHGSLRLGSFFFSQSFLCALLCIHLYSYVFKFTNHSSAELNLLLIPWSIFISDIKFFCL